MSLYRRRLQPRFADLRDVAEGDVLRRSAAKARLKMMKKAIEIGHRIFKLGYKYSESMGLRVLNAEGGEVAPIMGSYGIGIERILTTAVEEHNDKDGMESCLPPSTRLSPCSCHSGQ